MSCISKIFSYISTDSDDIKSLYHYSQLAISNIEKASRYTIPPKALNFLSLHAPLLEKSICEDHLNCVQKLQRILLLPIGSALLYVKCVHDNEVTS